MPHREGVDEFVRCSAARLAENGFVTAAPDVYHRRPAGENPIVSEDESPLLRRPARYQFAGVMILVSTGTSVAVRPR
jgi:dienelactone hydrolase